MAYIAVTWGNDYSLEYYESWILQYLSISVSCYINQESSLTRFAGGMDKSIGN